MQRPPVFFPLEHSEACYNFNSISSLLPPCFFFFCHCTTIIPGGNFDQLIILITSCLSCCARGPSGGFFLCLNAGAPDAIKSSLSLFSPWQLFKGKFFYCLGLDVKNITNKSDCLQANYKWVHHKYNFDNLGQVSVAVCAFCADPCPNM